ncbi:hypothetical protein DFH11DRAFT_1723799 [Phellopilus nigrolimitatus]|nr:hypothetical protein DFH11DRAFT_1723799 [Phellopilus nigrolimitatus]
MHRDHEQQQQQEGTGRASRPASPVPLSSLPGPATTQHHVGDALRCPGPRSSLPMLPFLIPSRFVAPCSLISAPPSSSRAPAARFPDSQTISARPHTRVTACPGATLRTQRQQRQQQKQQYKPKPKPDIGASATRTRARTQISIHPFPITLSPADQPAATGPPRNLTETFDTPETAAAVGSPPNPPAHKRETGGVRVGRRRPSAPLVSPRTKRNAHVTRPPGPPLTSARRTRVSRISRRPVARPIKQPLRSERDQQSSLAAQPAGNCMHIRHSASTNGSKVKDRALWRGTRREAISFRRRWVGNPRAPAIVLIHRAHAKGDHRCARCQPRPKVQGWLPNKGIHDAQNEKPLRPSGQAAARHARRKRNKQLRFPKTAYKEPAASTQHSSRATFREIEPEEAASPRAPRPAASASELEEGLSSHTSRSIFDNTPRSKCRINSIIRYHLLLAFFRAIQSYVIPGVSNLGPPSRFLEYQRHEENQADGDHTLRIHRPSVSVFFATIASLQPPFQPSVYPRSTTENTAPELARNISVGSPASSHSAF